MLHLLQDKQADIQLAIFKANVPPKYLLTSQSHLKSDKLSRKTEINV